MVLLKGDCYGHDSFYNGLSADHKKVYDEEAAIAIAWMNEQVLKSFDDYKAKLKAKGMTIVEPDVAAFQKIASPIVSAFAKETCRADLLADIAKQAK